MKKILISIFLVLSCFTTSFAEPNLAADKPAAVKQLEAEKLAAETDFLKGVKFGAGIMTNTFIGGKRPVESARVVNGIVRVEDEGRTQVGVIAEFHTLYPICWGAGGAATGTQPDDTRACQNDTAQLGHGPTIGLKLGSNNIIDAFFAGWMIALRPVPTSTKTITFALGGVVAPKVQVLGDGIEDGKPLPTGETEVRYKKINKYGAGLAISFAW